MFTAKTTTLTFSIEPNLLKLCVRLPSAFEAQFRYALVYDPPHSLRPPPVRPFL